MLNFKEGQMLLLDKPQYWTSFDLVKKIKYTIQKKTEEKKIKVGHAGTLDPLATGLMIICTGKMTKSIEQYQALPKEYIAKIKLGATTPSYDLETEIDRNYPYKHITEELLKVILQDFKGNYNQQPPLFSAKFVNGRRAYHLARKGENIKMEANKVILYTIELLNFELPVFDLRVVCSKGTYIRSLAHDIGKKINSGAHLIGLKRTAIGDYRLDKALTYNDFTNLIDFL